MWYNNIAKRLKLIERTINRKEEMEIAQKPRSDLEGKRFRARRRRYGFGGRQLQVIRFTLKKNGIAKKGYGRRCGCNRADGTELFEKSVKNQDKKAGIAGKAARSFVADGSIVPLINAAQCLRLQKRPILKKDITVSSPTDQGCTGALIDSGVKAYLLGGEMRHSE